MKKVFAILSLMVLVGCVNLGEKLNVKEDEMIVLNAQELSVNGSTEAEVIETMLSKATYKEAILNMTSSEEKAKIKVLERRAVNDYYILSKASKRVTITPEEIEKVYSENKKDLGEKTLEELTPAIKNLIYEAKLKNEIAQFLNEIKKNNNLSDDEKAESKNKETDEKAKKQQATKLSKAVYKQAVSDMKSAEDKVKRATLKRRAVNDYYILSRANEKIKITDEEIKKIFDENKKQLNGKTLEEVTPAIENLIYESKLKNEVMVTLNKLKKKYKINSNAKKYIKK